MLAEASHAEVSQFVVILPDQVALDVRKRSRVDLVQRLLSETPWQKPDLLDIYGPVHPGVARQSLESDLLQVKEYLKPTNWRIPDARQVGGYLIRCVDPGLNSQDDERRKREERKALEGFDEARLRQLLSKIPNDDSSVIDIGVPGEVVRTVIVDGSIIVRRAIKDAEIERMDISKVSALRFKRALQVNLRYMQLHWLENLAVGHDFVHARKDDKEYWEINYIDDSIVLPR